MGAHSSDAFDEGRGPSQTRVGNPCENGDPTYSKLLGTLGLQGLGSPNPMAKPRMSSITRVRTSAMLEINDASPVQLPRILKRLKS